MKIKVVDMTYEQALSQPPQKREKPKKPSLAFRNLLRAASVPDLRATHFRCERRGMEQLADGAPCLILVSVREQQGQLRPVDVANAACVVENMHLAATDLGLGSCYLWGVVQTMSQSLDIMYKLGLQEGFWPVSAVAVGHSRTPLE